MKLYSNAMSPYGRKVMTVVHELGLAGRVTLVDAQPRLRPEEVTALSPIGKIPFLELGDGRILRDSPVIAEYLCAECGGEHLLPATGALRWRILTEVADADAVIEATILVRNERLRPAPRRSAEFIEWNLAKVVRAIAYLEAISEELAERYDLGTIATGAAVTYVSRRLPEFEGLTSLPGLAAFRERMLSRHAFALTEPE